MAATLEYGPDGVDYGVVTLEWEPAGTAEDGSPIDVVAWHVEISYDEGETWDRAQTLPGSVTSTRLTGIKVPSTLSYSVLAVASNGQTSERGSVDVIEIPADEEAPPAPSSPITKQDFRILTIGWDGLFADSAERPIDFRHVEAHVGTTTGYTPDDTTYQGVLAESGSLQIQGLPTDVDLFVTLLSVDFRGNKSAPTAEVTIQVSQNVDVDAIVNELDGAKIIDDTIVASDKIAANSITAGEIAALAVTTDKLAANAITSDKIDAGAINGMVITGATLQTRADDLQSGIRFDDIDGLRAWNDDGVTTFQVDPQSGETLITGTLRTDIRGEFPRVQIQNHIPMLFANPDGDPGQGGDGGVVNRPGVLFLTGANNPASIEVELLRDLQDTLSAQAVDIDPGRVFEYMGSSPEWSSNMRVQAGAGSWSQTPGAQIGGLVLNSGGTHLTTLDYTGTLFNSYQEVRMEPIGFTLRQYTHPSADGTGVPDGYLMFRSPMNPILDEQSYEREWGVKLGIGSLTQSPAPLNLDHNEIHLPAHGSVRITNNNRALGSVGRLFIGAESLDYQRNGSSLFKVVQGEPIKASQPTVEDSYDEWVLGSFQQVINGVNATVSYAYIITYDRWVDYRLRINWDSNPGNVATQIDFPWKGTGHNPSPEVPAAGLGVTLNGVFDRAGYPTPTTLSVPISAAGAILLRFPSNPNNFNRVGLTGQWALTK